MSNVNEKLEEEFRPKTFEELAGNIERYKEIKDHLDSGTACPHFLFYGPAGTGKSSTAFVILRYLYGNKMRGKYLRTNASTSFKMDFIRDELIPFMNTAGEKTGIKIVILDEVDETPPKSQPALRDIMESNPYVKFILICNRVYKVIKPLVSRCKEYEFGPLTPEEMLPRLKLVAEKKEIKVSDEILLNIGKYSKGDMRSAYNKYMSKLVKFSGSEVPKDIKLFTLNTSEKYSIAITKDSLNDNLIQAIQRFKKALSLHDIKDIIASMTETIVMNKKYPNYMKVDMFITLSKAEKMLNLGSSDESVSLYIISKFDKIGLKYS